MATTTTPRPTIPEPAEQALGRGRPVGGFELWTWLFMRISGLLLLVLALGHTLIMHLPDGGVSRINFGFVAVRWESPFWRTWDWLLLSLALLHGVNGLRVVVLDYVKRPGARFALTWFFTIVGVILFALGAIIVFSFNPANFPQT